MKTKKTNIIPGTWIGAGDIHLGCKLYNKPELEEDIKQEFLKLCEVAVDIGAEYLVIAGDLFDTNKPTAALVDFVARALKKLRKAGVTPLAISGDHDKTIDEKNWCQIAGFDPISSVENLVGIDYNDVPEQVMEALTRAYNEKTEWVFLHGMVKELWPFCEEKKLLPVREFFLEHARPALRGFVLGDIHKPFEDTFTNPATGQKVWCGYTGSLGVTRTDELQKKGYLHWNGTELKRIPYELQRKFIEITLSNEWFDAMSEAEKLKSIEELNSNKNKPIVIFWYRPDIAHRLNELAFLFQHAIVHPAKLKADGSKDLVVNRSELKTEDKIDSSLRQVTCLRSERTFDLSRRLVRDVDGAKPILDAFKEEALRET